jgi:endoglucanase
MIAPPPQPVLFRFNQVGYVQGEAKRVLAMTPRPVRSRAFVVLGAHGRAVARGRARGPVRWSRRYVVYTLDFSVRLPGRYTIRFAGRRSPPLRVRTAATLYEPLTADALSFLADQRDGPEQLPGPLDRRPSHLRDASATVYAPPRYHGTTLLGGLDPTGAHIDASGGWFDAGDYLKFVETASFTDSVLLFTLRSFPAGVADRGALEREARFGTDWLLKMWDETDRVLYYQVGIGDGNGRTILGDHDLWRLPQADDARDPKPGSPTYYESYRPVFAANAPGAPISPNLAGRTAAAFALCAQVFAASDPAYAHRCLLAGQTLYDQADTAPRGDLLTTSPYAYYDETEWRDDMELGATELYLATQRALAAGPAATAGLPHTALAYYLQQAAVWANAYIEAPASGEDSLNLYDVSTLADYDLVQILRTPLALELRRGLDIPANPASLLEDRLDQLHLALQLASQEPFGLANPATNLDTVAHALGYSVQATMYDELAHSSAFAAFAQSQLDWVLGANAWGSSFVVGAGSVFPHCLASQIPNLAGSLTGRGAVMVGATVEGPTAPAGLRGLELPEGARPCPVSGRDPFAAFDGHDLAYLDDVRASSSSEPTDDLAALTLLASAQQAAG